MKRFKSKQQEVFISPVKKPESFVLSTSFGLNKPCDPICDGVSD